MADAFPADIEEVDVVVVGIRGEFFLRLLRGGGCQGLTHESFEFALIGVRLADTGGLAIH